MDISFRFIHIIFALAITTNVIYGSDETITIDVESEAIYPFNYKITPDAPIQGYAYELVKALMDETKLKNTISILPWSRVLNNALTKKNKLIYPIVRTPAREKLFNWVGEIVSLSYDLYCLSNKLPNTTISLDEVKNISVGVSRKGFRATYLKNMGFTNLIYTTGNKHTNKLLMRGRIDCIVFSNWGIAELKKEYEVKEGFLIKHSHFNIPKVPIYMALSLQTDKEIVAHIKESYQKLVDNGTHIKIIASILDIQK